MQAQQWYMTFPAEARFVMHDGVSHRFALNLHCWTDESSTDSSINQVVNHKKKTHSLLPASPMRQFIYALYHCKFKVP